MNQSIGILGVVEIVSALTIGIFVLSLTYKIIQYIGKVYVKLDNENLAFSIVTASILFSAGNMVAGVIQPILSSYRLLSESQSSLSNFGTFFWQGGLFISIAYVAALIISFISVILYARLTPVDEYEEIRKNNIGVAIMLGSIIITLTLLTKSGVGMVIEAIIPYPVLPPR